MHKVLLGILVIDRPRTTEKCLQHLLQWYRDRLTIVIIDNNSNAETKEVLEKYRKDVDLIITNDFNVGCVFAMNQYMALRESGQHFMKIDVDAYIIAPDWLDLMLELTKEPDLGIIMGRRPTFWHVDERFGVHREGTGDRHSFYVYSVQREMRRGIAIEVIKNPPGCVWPWGMITSNLIDQIGYLNEALCVDDLEYESRAKAVGLKAAYVPDVVILQHSHEKGNKDYEEQHHPEYNAYHDLLTRYWEDYKEALAKYINGRDLYCGSRFDMGSITSEYYRQKSDENWDFFKNYQRNKAL